MGKLTSVDAKGIELLKKHIKHWKKYNVNKTSYKSLKMSDAGDEPLCKEYIENCEKYMEKCVFCPISIDKGAVCCYKTPFEDISLLELDWEDSNKKPLNFEKKVQEHIEYLEGLLDRILKEKKSK